MGNVLATGYDRERFLFLREIYVGLKAIGAVLAGGLIATSSARTNAQALENWTTLGANPQRTSWIENDPEISTKQLRAPEFRLLWKNALTGRLGYQGSLSQPVLVQQLTTIRGLKVHRHSREQLRRCLCDRLRP